MKLLHRYLIGFVVAFFSLGSLTHAIEPIEIETRIGKEIREKLEQIPDLKAHNIVIRDHRRRITLLGTVSTESDREKIISELGRAAGNALDMARCHCGEGW